MAADGVIFEDLPPKATSGRRTPSWMLALIARPGEWARLPIQSTNSNKATYNDFEFAVRTVDGERRVYGRYNGNKDAE